jgi:hypothetical protein
MAARNEFLSPAGARISGSFKSISSFFEFKMTTVLQFYGFLSKI